jgi:uncharacterized protein YdhG (YjbR/CyaY superfamily)
MMPTHPRFTSHDDYIAAAHLQAQPILRQIGGIVEARVPQAVPCISYNMPAFKLARTRNQMTLRRPFRMRAGAAHRRT